MKRRQRRPVLDINNEQSESNRGRWQNKYQQIAVDHPEQNGSQNNNPLASLLGQYNSDSETEEGKQDANKLNDKVNDFLKEIQMIAPDAAKTNDGVKPPDNQMNSSRQNETSNCSWQECFDETTGYPYYWHVETNEVTWEMPSEMKINRDNKSGQNNQALVQQAQIPHPQIQQWANFLPNTYPELQTNIPEGMIPKEVVARNRNRQVGLAKGRLDLEISAETPKKIGPRDEDSDDEKIEMITSFGNDESESETSESESPSKKVPKSNSDKNSVPEDEDSLSIGPLLPPGIIPMIHGPENASLDMRSALEGRKASVAKRQSKNKTEDEVKEEIKEGGKGEDINEEDILKRLKNQAKLLQSLGGEVPESVETLINNDDDEDDIISQIEKEMPVDHAAKIEQDRQEKNDTGSKKSGEDDSKRREFKISLVAGYSDDSEPEDDISPKKISPQPLFPISEYVVKDNSNSFKGFGDSNPGRETNSIEIARQEEEEGDKFLDDSSIGKDNASRLGLGLDNDGITESQETEDNKSVRIESETLRQNLFLENLEIPKKAFQRKKRIAFDVVPNKTTTSRPQQELNSSKVSEVGLTFSRDDTERHGFGFHKDHHEADILESTDSCGEVLEPKQKAGVDVVQSKKSISFVKGEIASVVDEKLKPIPDFDKPSQDAQSTKQLKEMSEIVMEKVKFLSEGSQSISAIQIMVIQLQTLVAAWEGGDLRESYLYEWLKGTGLELGRLEEAAAPPGWDCHWDRSHKRYYYRNSLTGDAQWTYPDADVVGGTEEMDLCTTPPPPDDEDLLIIEEDEEKEEKEQKKETRNDDSNDKSKDIKSTLTITGDNNKIVQITNKDDYKSIIEAPPPPKISSPSPPPPPRIYAEDLKKGKKRRGSINDLRIADQKKEKSEFIPAGSTSDIKDSVDPPLPPSPPKNLQPPLPPNPPSVHAGIIPNNPNSEPLPPGVDPKDMPYPLPTVTGAGIESGIIYAAGNTQQTNPIYAATIGDRGAITLPIIDHRSGIIQGQLMHYPTYQHLHNQAMIAAAGSIGAQEAVQFMLTDYGQVYANTQVIAKPPVKTKNDQSLGSALDSFYNDIASIEKTNAEQESNTIQEFDQTAITTSTSTSTSTTISVVENNTTPPVIANQITPVIGTLAQTDLDEKINDPSAAAGKEKKRKKAKIGIGKKQKEMSSMVAKWQKAQQDFDDSE